MARSLLVASASVAAAGLLACTANDGRPTDPDPGLNGTCWALERVVTSGPGPGEVLWSRTGEPEDCGMSLCFASRGEFDARVSCNTCSGFHFDSGESLEFEGVGCTDAACTCGPGGVEPVGAWAVLSRDAEELVVRLPWITPGGWAVRAEFQRE